MQNVPYERHVKWLCNIWSLRAVTRKAFTTRNQDLTFGDLRQFSDIGLSHVVA